MTNEDYVDSTDLYVALRARAEREREIKKVILNAQVDRLCHLLHERKLPTRGDKRRIDRKRSTLQRSGFDLRPAFSSRGTVKMGKEVSGDERGKWSCHFSRALGLWARKESTVTWRDN